MRRRKMALRRRIRMLIVVLILVVVGILIVPISHFRVAAGEKNHSQIEYRTYVVQCGGWQTVIWERILIIIRITSKR